MVNDNQNIVCSRWRRKYIIKFILSGALHVWQWCKCLMNTLTQNIYVLSLYQADEIKLKWVVNFNNLDLILKIYFCVSLFLIFKADIILSLIRCLFYFIFFFLDKYNLNVLNIITFIYFLIHNSQRHVLNY